MAETLAFSPYFLYLCKEFAAFRKLSNGTFSRPPQDFSPFAARSFPDRRKVFPRPVQSSLLGPSTPSAPSFQGVCCVLPRRLLRLSDASATSIQPFNCVLSFHLLLATSPRLLGQNEKFCTFFLPVCQFLCTFVGRIAY